MVFDRIANLGLGRKAGSVAVMTALLASGSGIAQAADCEAPPPVRQSCAPALKKRACPPRVPARVCAPEDEFFPEDLADAIAKATAPAQGAPAAAAPAMFAAPPQGGQISGESNAIGIRGLELHFPEMRFALPTLQLPSLVRIRRNPEMQIDGGRAPLVGGAAATYGQIAAGGNVQAAPAAATAPAQPPAEQTPPAATAPARRRPTTTAPASAPKRCAPARCAPASEEETHDVELLPPPLPGSDQTGTRPGRNDLEETRRAITLARQQLDQLTAALEAAEAAQALSEDVEELPAPAPQQTSQVTPHRRTHTPSPGARQIRRVEAAEVESAGELVDELDLAFSESDEATGESVGVERDVSSPVTPQSDQRRQSRRNDVLSVGNLQAPSELRPGYAPVPVKESTSLLKKAGKFFKRG